jgi:hypothetical protein
MASTVDPTMLVFNADFCVRGLYLRTVLRETVFMPVDVTFQSKMSKRGTASTGRLHRFE